MGRSRKSGFHLPRYVYWRKNQFAYKAKDEFEYERLGRRWTPLGKTERELWENYANLMKRLGETSGMETLFTRYEREVIPTKGERTQEDNKKQLPRLKAVFGKMEPFQMTRSIGVQYLEKRSVQAKTQAKQEFALLRHILTKAVDWGMIQVNPLLGTQVNRILKIKVRDRVPELWELLAVKKHGDPLIKLWIDFKYQTGLNQKDILEFPLPDFKADQIPVARSKTNQRGYLELTEDLEATCRGLIALNKVQGPTLICNTRGKPMTGHAIWQRWRKAVLAAIEAGDLKESFTENDIRSAFATDSEELYGLDATAQLLHGSQSAKKHYVHKRRGHKVTPLPAPKKQG